MKLTCFYSNVSFNVSYFNDWKLTSKPYSASKICHPIMDADTKILLSRAADWTEGRFSPIEQRLLFVALLKATDLIEWRAPALPSDTIIARQMELLIRTVGWKTATGYHFSLPKFSMHSGTNNCKTIGNWLDKWNEEKDNFFSRAGNWEFKEKLALREKALARLLTRSNKGPGFYKNLAAWVMDASDAPKGIREIWTEIFLLDKDTKIWAYPTVDIEELLEHMIDHLPADSSFGHAAFLHIRTILAKNRGQLEYALGMTNFADLQEELEDIKGQGYILLPAKKSAIEEYNYQVSITTAPKEEPKQENYPSYMAYIKDKIKWQRAQEAASGVVKKQELLEQQEREKEKDWEVSNAIAQEEDDTEDSSYDLDDLIGDLSALKEKYT